MSKRSVVLVALGLALLSLLSACGGGDLAEDLTPIPTIQPGEEPELSTPLEPAAPAAATGETLSEDELVALGEETLLTIRNFGQKSLDELTERLEERGFLEEGWVQSGGE